MKVKINKFIRKDLAPLCACGCGERVKWGYWNKGWNKYIYQHACRNRSLSDETKKKISMATSNMSDETKAKMSRAKIGHKHSNETRRKMSLTAIGKLKSEEHKRNISLAKQNPSLEIRKKMSLAKLNMSEETKKKMSLAKIGGRLSNETKNKISIAALNMSEETKLKMSGENHHNWKGGISCEPYCPIWTDQEYKKSIRERDNHTCQNPNCWETSNRLCGHHIDYDKKNCNPWNVITVCNSCNIRANKDREYWRNFYQEIMVSKTNKNL